MKKHALKLVSLVCIALAALFLAPPRAAADEDDPPGRVARLSYTRGAVSFNPAGTDDWVNAVVNRPMTTGDKLWTDDRARAELHIGSAVIRLSDHTGFSFLNLTDNVSQIRVTEGTINIRVRSLGDDETFEVDTPNLAFSVLRPGHYRINVNESGDTTMVVVRDGAGEVTGGGSAYTIHAREAGNFYGGDQLDADIQSLRDYYDDDFDHWCSDRDHREDRSISSRYVSRDVIGYEDLDDYGGWRPVPGYGNVWFPQTTVAGWAPYRYGHWVWISPWGWTWVDDEPWGFAPFHYGRWVVVRGEWGWVPAPPRPAEVEVAYVRPVYAPALVAWVGGSHFSMSIAVGGGGGGVAWFPLGPREVYVPSYHVSPTYVNNVNVSNTTVNNTYVTNVYNTTVVNQNVNVQNNTTNNVHINNIKYVNQSVPGAVTATSHEAFASAQPVATHMVKVDAREVVNAPVATQAVPIAAPPKQAVLGAGAPAQVRPPAVVETRAVVAKTAPPPPPVRFEKQQELIKANGGKPPAITEIRQREPERAQTAPVPVKIAPQAKPAMPQNSQANRADNLPNNPGNRPGPPANVGQPPVNAGNRPGATNNPPPPENQGNRPAVTNNPPRVNQDNKPGNPTPPVNQGNRPAVTNNAPPVNQDNKPGNPPSNAGNPKPNNDRPPSSRPADTRNVNPQTEQKQQQLDQKHEREQEQLRQKQDQERPRIEQPQQQERQKSEQKNPEPQHQPQVEQRQPKVEQKPQPQVEQVERKHEQQQQKVEQKPQQERQKEKPADKPKDKPKDKDKDKDKDKPSHR